MFSAFLLFAVAAAAPPKVPDDCRDDRGSDRCAAAEQARMRALYGLSTIEEHERAGDQVRRGMYVDGYGRDVIAISFARASGREPTVTVYFPRREGQDPVAPLTAPVPYKAWTSVLEHSRNCDRSFLPRKEKPGEIKICVHAWNYVVEANDPARANYDAASLRRKAEDACSEGPAQDFAIEAERTALSLFPHCDRLDPEQHRNPASQLAACAILHGDRMAAAEVMNRADVLRYIDGADYHRLGDIFAVRTMVDFQGQQIKLDMLRGPEIWASKLADKGSVHLFIDSITGLSADKARLIGKYSRSIEGPVQGQMEYYLAPVELDWTFTSLQEWQVDRATVGAWVRDR